MPYTKEIYRPQAVGGKLLESSCRYNSGPGQWDTVEFDRAGARIRFSAFNGYYGPTLFVSITLLEGDTAEISPPTAMLTSPAFSEPVRLLAKSYSWYEQGQEKTQPIDEKIIVRNVLNIRRNYYISFRADQTLPEAFEVIPPQILLNGKPIELPPIKFNWEKALMFMTINC